MTEHAESGMVGAFWIVEADGKPSIVALAVSLEHADPYGHMLSVDTGHLEHWSRLARRGGEGIVMKPGSFVARGSRGLIQPALKVRGAEYLRLIYGPEYTLPGKLERLRQRGPSGKRRLALQEFALGLEGLQRFVKEEP
jgi:hypothetical protein